MVYRLGSLGDTVVALPSLHLTARAFPEAELRMLTGFQKEAKAPPASAILANMDLIHGYVQYRVGSREPAALFKLWWQLVCWRPQVLVYMCAARGIGAAKRDALFFRLCLIASQVGVPITDDMQRSRRIETGTSNPKSRDASFYEYECSRLARNLAELGDARLEDPRSWDLRLSIAERSRAECVLDPIAIHPFIAVSVGTKMQAKDWGLENWRSLLQRLSQEYPFHAVVLCGAVDEFEGSAYVQAGFDGISKLPSINLCGLLTPRETAAVFERAALFVGHDSGPMHLAAATQTPCVAIFSARSLPGVWFPYGDQHGVLYRHVPCENCQLETCVIERKKCIMSITVNDVLRKIKELKLLD